jgi:hypothetical protein
MEENGNFIRIYPMPFRLVEDEKQFKKWQWITARVEKSKKDHRPESNKIFVDTIICDEAPLSTKNDWQARRHYLQKLKIADGFDELDSWRKQDGVTLGVVRPTEISGLDITPSESTEWTKAEREKLLRLQQQGDLFDDSDPASIATLKKVPIDFHYRYKSVVNGLAREHRHKIVDWEIGALYWNVHRRHGANWQQPFREKLEKYMPSRDLHFLMGTIHRFPDQWLIVSLIYPPKPPPGQSHQQSLFDP